MRKIFSVFAIMFMAVVSLYAGSTKNIHILIDTGKSMRDDNDVEVYKLAGSYVNSFIRDHHNDSFGKNVNIVVSGVVKHKDGPQLLTVPYVNRKAGSPLDLSALANDKMSPNPPDWMTSWDLDKAPTNLDLFQNHFFNDAKDTVFVVITNSNVGQKTFFGKQSSTLLAPQQLDVHRADFPNNVRVFLINLPAVSRSGKRIFQTTTARERINLGMNAAWNAVIYEKPRFSMLLDLCQNGVTVNSCKVAATDADKKSLPGVYAPAKVKLNVLSAVAVRQINVRVSDDIANKEFKFSDGENSMNKEIVSLGTPGTYTIYTEVIGKNGDVHNCTTKFNVFRQMKFEVSLNNAKVKTDKKIVKGYAPLKVAFATNISNVEGYPEWSKNGKKFDPYKENIFNENATVVCKVKGCDGKIYSKTFEIQILKKEFEFKAAANSVALGKNGVSKISGLRPFAVKFEANTDKNTVWFRNNKRFVPGRNAVIFNNSEVVKCIYTENGRNTELYINVNVIIPPPKAPVISVTANGTVMSPSKNSAIMEIEKGSSIKFDFLAKENVATIRYFRNGVPFRNYEKINSDCEIEVRAANKEGNTVSQYITVKIPQRLAKLTATADGKNRDDNGFLNVATNKSELEVTFGFDTQIQLDELKKYSYSIDGDRKITPQSYSWKETLSTKAHLVQLFYENKECDKFTITIRSNDVPAKLLAEAGNRSIRKGFLNVNTNDSKATVYFSLDSEYQLDELKKYSISYGDGTQTSTLQANRWSHDFKAGKTYQVKLFRNNKVCDKFTLGVTRSYVLSFDMIVVDDNTGIQTAEDGSKSLYLTEGNTVRFTVKGISPQTDRTKLVYKVIDASETEMFSINLADLKKEIEEAQARAIAEGEIDAESVKNTTQTDASEFSWEKNDFAPGNYTVKFINDGKEESVTVIVNPREEPPTIIWPYIVCALAVIAVVFFIAKRNIKISCQAENRSAVEKKIASGEIVLNKKFSDAPELKLTISDKVIIHEKENTAIEWCVGNNPMERVVFENGKAARRLVKGKSKEITINVKQDGSNYTIKISK